jgi:hypothetical protein
MKLIAPNSYVFRLAILATILICCSSSQAAISYTGDAYTQDFNSLNFSGATPWTSDSTLPGWSLFRRPAPGTAITSITGGAGTSNTGAFYSFGLGDGDQALGGVGSGGTYWGSPSTGTVAGWMAVAFTNSTGSSIDAFTVNFDGEQWRNGGNASTQTMVLEYGLGTSFEGVSGWTAPGGTFDFVSPIATASAGALDGNSSENRVAGLGGEISGINWSAGETLWLRWIELNDAGNDHGLAIDNFMFSTGTVIEPVNNADFDGDGDVDGRDFLIWQRGYGNGFFAHEGDANGDNSVDGLDLEIWQSQYGTPFGLATISAVPEPTGVLLLITGMGCLVCGRRVQF